MHIKLKVPYFKQEKWYTCGPACLRMLLACFDVTTSEGELVAACGTTELGTVPIQISEGAYKFLNAWNIFKNWMIICKQ